jgi:copper chaperone
MISFTVDDMSCGHCAGAITRAVRAVDDAARVEVDLAAHRVHVSDARVDAQRLAEAIREAGYTPVPAPPAAADDMAPTAAASR